MNRLTPSTQDYLKALLELSRNGEPVHSVDVASAVGVSRASVSKAMDTLKASGYVTKEKYGPILLTEMGKQAAGAVKEKNVLITTFLTDVLGVDKKTAKTEACRMEHTISTETAYRLRQYLRGARETT